jgi:hypothetical protein
VTVVVVLAVTGLACWAGVATAAPKHKYPGVPLYMDGQDSGGGGNPGATTVDYGSGHNSYRAKMTMCESVFLTCFWDQGVHGPYASKTYSFTIYGANGASPSRVVIGDIYSTQGLVVQEKGHYVADCEVVLRGGHWVPAPKSKNLTT